MDIDGKARIAKALDNIGIPYKQQYVIEHQYRFDFYLPYFRSAIVYDEAVNWRRADKIKNKFCKDNNIKLMRVRYDHRGSLETEIIHFLNPDNQHLVSAYAPEMHGSIQWI